jgi:hypothetical protein
VLINVLAMERHNSPRNRDAYKESPRYTASRWILP